MEFYTRRPRRLDEVFPWDFIDVEVSKDFLLREWLKAIEGRGTTIEGRGTTANCREHCSGCGARTVGEGVCFENSQEYASGGRQTAGETIR